MRQMQNRGHFNIKTKSKQRFFEAQTKKETGFKKASEKTGQKSFQPAL